jgi:signal transduction histidine kinase
VAIAAGWLDATIVCEAFMDRPKIFPRRASASDAVSNQPSREARDPMASIPARPAKLAWVDVRPLVDEVCAGLAPRLAAAGIETTIDVPHSTGVVADREMLRTAIENLATNAIEAMSGGGDLVVTSYSGSGGFELEIADSGPGLSDTALRAAFEPFYTTKRDAAGMGLAVVRRIAKAHYGDVVAMNCPEGGAAFTLRFPPRAREAAA